MSDPRITSKPLIDYVTTPDVELRGKDLKEREGSFGGRVMRQLHIWFGKREAQQSEIKAAKDEVLEQLKSTYGEKIAKQAWHAVSEKSSFASKDQPITGRHVSRLLTKSDELLKAEELRNPKLADWIDESLGAPEDGRKRAAIVGTAIHAWAVDSGRVSRGQCDDLASKLRASLQDVMKTSPHGFWIVDLRSEDGASRWRLPLHINRDKMQGWLTVRVGNTDYTVEEREFGKWLENRLGHDPWRVMKDVSTISLHPVTNSLPQSESNAKPNEFV